MRTTTVRSRVLAAMLLLCSLGLLIAGFTAYGLERRKVDARIDDSLIRSVTSFRDLASSGLDPETGQPFTTASSLVYVAIQRTIPAPNEGMIGYAQGHVRWYAPEAVSLRLEADEAFVEHLSALQVSDSVLLKSFASETADYRFAAVPVAVGPDETGTFVIAYDRAAELAALGDTFRTYALVAVSSLVLIGLVGWVLAGRFLSPIRRLRDTAQQISESDLSARIPVQGNDDLSDLTRTFNDMVERLEQSFVSQRQLLDDVGHELRTPLTIVGGHLEVMDPHDPVDVVATREIALDEISRMGRLVNDLMTLATADRPDFVRRDDIDLGRLTDDVLDKARALAPRTWVVDARADGPFPLDSQRITQAWLQLASNAVKYSAEGSTIALGSVVAADEARIWVRDEGTGIAPHDLGKIFGRFARAGTGGAPDREGVGLGLAIVAAIAAAHDGSADVESTEGTGSTFTVTFRRPALEPGTRQTVELSRPAHDDHLERHL
ncbi:ATP-binding protein [Sanguibacter sp. 25GB23B1]|uniref:sensor histidine kinase n=1 Tax=unclassified Sanguibacter TaxID=2645534 RepID=UPI0032AE9DE6